MADLIPLRKQNKRTLGKLISSIENEDSQAFPLLDKLYKHTGRALRIGITGFPGAGKSTLVNRLIHKVLENKKSVAAVLVDPTSPFTGGAILGDRVRLQNHVASERVFVRSMATRGRLGGLAATTHGVCDVLDAAGFDFIFIETVGVGQLEVDIASSADLVCVVLMPQIGDEVQAMKAGLMEIANLFIVNKIDLDPKREQYQMLKKVFQEAIFRPHEKTAPVLATCAQSGKGVDEVYEEIAHFKRVKVQERVHFQLKERLKRLAGELYFTRLIEQKNFEKRLSRAVLDIQSKKKSPYRAAQDLLK
jgi:LAO/AO transport system kinase